MDMTWVYVVKCTVKPFGWGEQTAPWPCRGNSACCSPTAICSGVRHACCAAHEAFVREICPGGARDFSCSLSGSHVGVKAWLVDSPLAPTYGRALRLGYSGVRCIGQGVAPVCGRSRGDLVPGDNDPNLWCPRPMLLLGARGVCSHRSGLWPNLRLSCGAVKALVRRPSP